MRLRATIHFPQLSALPTIVARLRRVFDLAADPEVIGAHLAEDPVLAPLVAARPGLRVPGAWDGFELAVRAVLGQQITVSGAATLAGKLVAIYGEPLAEWSPERRRAHARLPLSGAPGRGESGRARHARGARRGACLPGPRGGVRSADLRAETEPRRSDRPASALPGIGEWTAQYIAMRELREPDAFPAADLGLMRAMTNGKGRRPSPAELLARAERWRPWRAYAAQHLWASGGVAHAQRVASRPAGRARLTAR